MSVDISPIPNYVPSGMKILNVLISIKNAVKAIEFYNRAFDAEEVMRLTSPDGTIAHSEIKISDTVLMITEDLSGKEIDFASKISLQLYVGDADAFVENAVKAGCVLELPVERQFYGDNSGRVKDPFGISWIISTHVENMTAREMQKRFNEYYS